MIYTPHDKWYGVIVRESRSDVSSIFSLTCVVVGEEPFHKVQILHSKNYPFVCSVHVSYEMLISMQYNKPWWSWWNLRKTKNYSVLLQVKSLKHTHKLQNQKNTKKNIVFCHLFLCTREWKYRKRGMKG